MFRSLQKFSGEIINADGQSVRKIKKSELQKSEYSSSLSTDDYFILRMQLSFSPFTVKYEWEVKCNNGLIGYPPLYRWQTSTKVWKSDLPDRTARRTRMQIS